MQTGFYEFLGYEDLAFIGLIALLLIARNWWDLIRYSFARGLANLPAQQAGMVSLTRSGVRKVARRLRRRALTAHRRTRHHPA
jgi:hypothetical protein